MTDRLRGLLEARRFPIPAMKTHIQERIDRLLAGGQELGLQCDVGKRGDLLGFEGIRRPGHLEAIRLVLASTHIGDLADLGEAVWRQLSGISHAEAAALYTLMERVDLDNPDEAQGFAVARLPAASIVLYMTPVLVTYMEATERSMRLYGWDRTNWISLRTEALRLLRKLIRGDP
jgi:hypothetical protein